MVETCQHLGFALEAGEALGVGGYRLGQDLDRDFAAQLGVFSAIDLTHAAFAELGGDLEVRKGRVNHV